MILHDDESDDNQPHRSFITFLLTHASSITSLIFIGNTK